MRREASIRALLREGPRTPAAIVEALYVPLDPRLKGAAEASVLAHLLKLRAEGMAEEQGGVWQARG